MRATVIAERICWTHSLTILGPRWAPYPSFSPPVGLSNWIRLGRDHYDRIASNDYSVDPRATGRFGEVIATPEVGGGHLRVPDRRDHDHRSRSRHDLESAAS